MERLQEGLRTTLGRPDDQIRSPGRLLLLLITISLFLSVHCAAAIQLPDEMARFVPECGRECFLSHMKVYYGVADEQWIPSLQLLCSTLGLSSITIGEGAYGCLLGERRIGFCSKEEITDALLYKAYHMCSDKPKAIKPTHAVFIPRFTRPASLPGRLIVPPLSTSSKSKQSTTSASTTTTTTTTTTSSSSSSSSSSLSQTLTTDQGSDLPSDTTSASSSSGSTRTQPPTSTSPTSSTTTTTESSASSSDSIAPPSAPDSSSAPSQPSARPTDVLSDVSNDKQPPPLSIGEKAGIAVGAVSLAGAALSLLLFFCHRRRRQARTHASPAPAKGPAAQGPDKGLPPPAAGLFPGPKSPLPPAPVAYSPASWRRSTIGLALSPMQAPWPSAPPPGSSPPPPRRFSKLLPAKPVLRPRRVPSADARLRPAPPPVRDSATTEFEEDGQASPPPMVPIWLGPPLPAPDAVELEANPALPPPLFAVSVEPPSPESTPWPGLRLVDPSPSPEAEAGHGASPGRRRHHPPMPLPGSLNGPAPGSRSCPTAALAAKRLGPERAAALAIATPPPSTRNRPPAWRRLGPSPEGPGSSARHPLWPAAPTSGSPAGLI